MHGCEDAPYKAAPVLGEDTDKVLKTLLSLSDAELERLHASGTI